MGVKGILAYTGRAARFALVAGAAYGIVRAAILIRRGARPHWKNELRKMLFAIYLAALVEIIALRGGPGDTRELQLIPMKTTLGAMLDGPWALIYHAVGNAIWFAPLGMFLGHRSAGRAVLTGTAASCGLEILQWILKTGVTDADDILLNTLGALAGWFLIKLWLKRKEGRT